MPPWLRIVLLLAVVAAATGLALWPRIRDRLAARRLHRRLAAANRLTQAETRWLWQVAVEASPERPALIFVRPSLLEARPAARDADLARGIYEKLFSS